MGLTHSCPFDGNFSERYLTEVTEPVSLGQESNLDLIEWGTKGTEEISTLSMLVTSFLVFSALCVEGGRDIHASIFGLYLMHSFTSF